ncbi:FG-GAP-like repeat-containing protein [Candidatus Neomarinimicrobiota bacterium]
MMLIHQPYTLRHYRLLALLTALVLMIPHPGWGQTSKNITTSLEVPHVPFAQASSIGGRNIIAREPGLKDDAKTALNEGDTIEMWSANSSPGNDATYITTYADSLEKRYERDVETARLNEGRRTSPAVLESSPRTVTYVESEEDTDDDGMPNSWEIANSLDPDDPSDAWEDPDGDFVLNLFEYQLDSSPSNSLSPASVIVYADGNPMNAIANAPTGSIIRVESGNYNVNYRLFSPKTIMIQGGWNSDFTIRDPIVTPTTFDGRSLEEVLYFSFDGGMNSIILDGLTLINGNGNFGALAMIASGTSVMKWSMINCRIIDSNNPEAAGGAIAHINHWDSGQSDVFIIKSIIANNTSSGIANQTTGTASGRWKIIHANITNNYSEDADEGYGIHAFTLDYAPLNIELTNTILWGNQRTDLFVNQAITVNAEYSDVGMVDAYSGAIYNAGSGIFKADPLFVDADNADFTLEAGSPCIDTGIDIGLPFLGAAPDVGALEYTADLNSGLVAYYPFSGNANDESGNGNDGTEHSVTLAEDRFGRVDSAYSFSGGYISMPTDASILNTPIDQYTFQAWIRSTSSTGNPQNVFETHTQAPSGNREIYFEADMPAPMRFGITDVSGADHQVVSNSLELNTWYQVVGTYDGSKQKIYIDGELQDSLVWSSSFTINSGAELGKDMEGGQYFQGQLDDIRIYNRALSAAEINSLYHEKGWDPDLLVHYPFNGNANDESGNGNNGTVNGATQTTDRFGNASSAYSFDGVDDYIYTPVRPVSGALTISLWMKSNSSVAFSGLVLSHDGIKKTGLLLNNPATQLRFTLQTTAAQNAVVAADQNYLDDAWHHVVGSYDGTELVLLIDNVVRGTVALTGDVDLGDNFQISRDDAFADRYYSGIIDDIRIYNRALSEAEVEALYHEGGWDIPPPEIVSTSPTQNALNVAQNAGISVTFDMEMNAASLDETTFVVHASQTGKLSGTYSYNPGDSTATFTPDSPFKIGEQVSVILTAGVQSAAGSARADPYAWSFTTGVIGGSGEFLTQTTYDAGDNSQSVTAADLDGDGDVDLAVVNRTSDNISVLMNQGSGIFATAVNYEVGSSPRSVTAGDLDGDGDVDLTTANYYSTNVSVLLNHGSGTFAAAVNYAAGSNPHDIAVADFDGDGASDLAVADWGNDNVSILLNSGNGVFSADMNYAVGSTPHDVRAADLDGDGDIDLVAANYGDNNVSVLLNSGNGIFATAVNYAVGTYPYFAISADLDGDGDLDLATANSLSDNISVLLNQGDGTYADAVDYSVGNSPRSISAADLDGDGDTDLAVANRGSNNFSALVNQGDGTFATAVDYDVGSSPHSITAADLDGDGDLDLATANYSSNNVSVLLNAWEPTPPTIVSTSPTQNALNVAQNAAISVTFDMDMDAASLDSTTFVVHASLTGTLSGTYSYDHGSHTATFIPDSPFKVGEQVNVILTTGVQSEVGESLTSPHGWSFTIEVEDGSGEFALAANYALGDKPYAVTAADLDGDGDLDLAAVNEGSHTVSVVKNNGDGSFQTRTDYGTGSVPRSVFAADLDSDGDLELVTANDGSHTVSVLKNNGDGSYQAKTDYGTGNSPRSVLAADFDGDADQDLAVTNAGSASLSVLLNDGDGDFLAQTSYGTGGYPWQIFSADLDGDGNVDLVTANEAADNISVLLGTGDGSFATQVTYEAGDSPRSVAAVDLDGDGALDLVATNEYTNNLSVLLGNGNGTFTAQVTYATGSYPSWVRAADLDGDGDLDLATANNYSDNVSVMLGHGNGTFEAQVTYTVGDYPISVCATDLDGDGDLDLATANYNSDNVSILLNTGGAPPDTDLVAYFPFNGNANDETGNGNDGTVAGAILAVDRFSNADHAYSFDGVDDVITGLFVPGSGMDTAITTTAWFYQPAEAGHPGAGIVGVGATGNQQHFYQRLFADYGDSNWDGADGQNRLFIGADDGINDRWWGSDSVITTNEWHFATTTYSSASREVRIYIDGTPDRIINLSDDLSLTNYLFIGCDGHNDNYFEGRIDDIRIYNRALVDAEIQALYQEGGWLEMATVDTQYVTGSTNVEFPGTDVWMNFDFTSQTGVDTVVVKAFQATPGGNLPASMSLVEPRYWEFAHSGEGVFSVWLEFDLGAGAFNADDQANPAQIKLLRRGSASVTDWTIAAEGVSASESTIFFGSITGFSQFAIGRSTDTEAPTISNVSVPASASRGITVSVSASVTDASALDTVILNYRSGGSTDYSRVGMNSLGADTYNGNILGTAVTESGLAYFIVAEDEYGNRDSSSTVNIPVEYYSGIITTGVSVSAFSSGFPFNKWRLISLPSNVNDKSVASIIQGVLEIAPSDETWELHRYVGFYEETEGLVLGESYFLKQIVTEDALHFTLGAGESVDLSGWNFLLPSRSWSFISSPYPFPVSVSADQVTFDGPYTYGEFGSGGQEGWSMGQVQTTFRPWGGYIIYNNTNQNQTLDIEPLTLSKGRLAKEADYPPDGWLVNITVEGERYYDGGNTIGRLAGAAEGRDDFDTPEPPLLEGYISLAMDQPDWSDGTARFTSDIRPMDDMNGIWDLDLRTRGEKGPINLTFEVVGNVPDDIQVALLDLMERQAYGLTVGEKPEAITEYNESLPYYLKVISGTADFVDGAIEEALSQLPEDFALAQNYPNPFNAVTTIEYALPKPARVSLRVYNVLGKESVTLLNDWQDIGYHEIVWSGADDLGRDIASGVYFAVLQSEGVIKTRKMVLLK